MSRVPWLGAGVALAAMVVAFVLSIRAGEAVDALFALFPFLYLAFAAVGALILSQRPGHRIGRLALIAGIAGSLFGLADSYAQLRDDVPFLDWAAWVANCGFPTTLAPILFLVLLFPDGHLPGPRWRIVAWLLTAGVTIATLGLAVTPQMVDWPGRVNPLGVQAVRGTLLEQGSLGWYLIIAGIAGAGLALAWRFRRSTGIERQQLKWIASAALLQAAVWPIAILIGGFAPSATQGILFLTLLLIPLAAGIAVLRYRLYDIDVVIRRTLVYGAVVAILAAVYAGLVLALQTALQGFTGGGTLPVAVSTLVIAALFGPLRSRVRAVVDRRFFRSRYDAQRMLEAFSTRLRDEVELEAVGQALTDASGRALQPASVGVWLRRTAP